MEGVPATALLGDTPARDYSRKLHLFNAFAAPELRTALDSLDVRPGMHILDAGCGTGEALRWLAAAVGLTGAVTGIDLAAAHVAAARAAAPERVTVLQGNLLQAPFCQASFDRIWSINTINHLSDPVAGVKTLAGLLKPAGRIAIGQSSLLPDMFFAWDSRLERLTNEAVREYYRRRYAVGEEDLTGVRALVGVLRAAGLQEVAVRTHVIERIAPLLSADESYLLEVLLQGTWGERLRPYLSAADFAELTRLCDPQNAGYALRRPDFHFLQTFTLAVGVR